MPAGVAVWQPYGAVGWKGLDGVWVACGTLARTDAGGWGKWRVACGTLARTDAGGWGKWRVECGYGANWKACWLGAKEM